MARLAFPDLHLPFLLVFAVLIYALVKVYIEFVASLKTLDLLSLALLQSGLNKPDVQSIGLILVRDYHVHLMQPVADSLQRLD